MQQPKTYYRRLLPHWQPFAATIFITFRLAGSLPQRILAEMTEERDRLMTIANEQQDPERRAVEFHRAESSIFARWDRLLADAQVGEKWLARADVARVVANSIHRAGQRLFELEAYCIMPNHVHAVVTPRCGEDGQCYSLAEITRAIKGASAYESNQILGRSGQFWQHESYDHMVRDADELLRVVRYVLLNPVKAGLVSNWRDWPWSYARLTPEGL